ncbi:MAG TPA: hypothetical protein DC022_07210 [Alcanivorax sp.]|nr:hypothetical protein [Alcanivorax sp.]
MQYNSGIGDRSGLDRERISLAFTRSRCRSSLPGDEPRVSVEIARRAIRDAGDRQVFPERNACWSGLFLAKARFAPQAALLQGG